MTEAKGEGGPGQGRAGREGSGREGGGRQEREGGRGSKNYNPGKFRVSLEFCFSLFFFLLVNLRF